MLTPGLATEYMSEILIELLQMANGSRRRFADDSLFAWKGSH
jgi:hypothetical protein